MRGGQADKVRGRKACVCLTLLGADGISLWAWQALELILPLLGGFGFLRDSLQSLGDPS